MKREVGPRHRNLHLFFIRVSFDWFTILQFQNCVISKRRGARENGLKIMDFRGLWSLSFITGLAMVEWLYLSCQARQPWQLRVRVKVLQNDVLRVVYLNFSRLSGDKILLLYHYFFGLGLPSTSQRPTIVYQCGSSKHTGLCKRARRVSLPSCTRIFKPLFTFCLWKHIPRDAFFLS